MPPVVTTEIEKTDTANGDLPSIQELADKLQRVRCRLMTREPWYGHIAMNMEWIPSQMTWKDGGAMSKTMGVRIVNGGVVQCLWYPGFVHKQTFRELYGVIMHEIEHIVRCHCVRVGLGRHHMQWNIAADMVTNGKKAAPICAYNDPTSGHILPVGGNGVYLPEDWETGQTTEAIYDRLGKVTQQCPKCGGSVSSAGKGSSCGGDPSSKKGQQSKAGKGKGKGKGQGAGQGQGQGAGAGPDQGQDQGQGQGAGQGQGQGAGQGQGQGAGAGPDQGQHTCSNCGGDTDGNGHASSADGHYRFGEFSGKQMDDHDIWQQTDVSADEARQLIKDMTDQATQKCQGTVPAHLSQILSELSRPVVRWWELLRQYIGTHVGNRRSTYSRRNRRVDLFGMAGVSHHAAGSICVVVDTSGSISNNELQQFFTEIEAISSWAKVHILQWDAAFQGYKKYRRGDWKKFKINGRGGTSMDQAIMWLTENKVVADCTILLTDGYTGWAPKQPWFPEKGMITVITSQPDAVTKPDWGMVVFMKKNHK